MFVNIFLKGIWSTLRIMNVQNQHKIMKDDCCLRDHLVNRMSAMRSEIRYRTEFLHKLFFSCLQPWFWGFEGHNNNSLVEDPNCSLRKEIAAHRTSLLHSYVLRKMSLHWTCHHAMRRNNNATPKITEIQKPCKQFLKIKIRSKNLQSLKNQQKWWNVSSHPLPWKLTILGSFSKQMWGNVSLHLHLVGMHNHLRHLPTVNFVKFPKLVVRDKKGNIVKFVNFVNAAGKLSLQINETL